MGAQWFQDSVIARNAKEGYNILCEEAIREYGEDGYNGTISTTNRVVMVKSYPIFLEKNINEVNSILKKYETNGEKWTAYCIDLGVISYNRISYKKISKQVNVKYKLGYVLKKRGEYFNDWIEIAFGSTKKELEKYIQREIKNDSNVELIITKEYKNISGNNIATNISITKEKLKNNKYPKKTKNTICIEEIHKYLFFGLASC